MGKYYVSTGQNIYDIAMHIYGSVEGIVDLMMNNTGLSLCDDLKTGTEVLYTDDFVINPDIVNYFRMNSITPSNGERNVYFKTPSLPKIMEVFPDQQVTTPELLLSGSGTLQIDWGDNSPLESVTLSGKVINLSHYFDNIISDQRKISIYGTSDIDCLDLSKMKITALYIINPVTIQKFIANDSRINLDFISLFSDTLNISLKCCRFTSLLPLVDCKELMELDISDCVFDQEILDEYLITLVTRHYGRGCCKVTTSMKPSGEYREPGRDGNQSYIIKSGMEAVWLLVNEPSWNEAGNWAFYIRDEVYTKS